MSETQGLDRDALNAAVERSARLEEELAARPEVSDLLLLASLCGAGEPREIAERSCDRGAGTLKRLLTEALNEYLRPIRRRRAELERERAYIGSVLRSGIETARETGAATFEEVRAAMDMTLAV